MALGGREVDFDWLLDIGAGISWSCLQHLRIHRDRTVLLTRPLSDLESLWHQHLDDNTPLQYLLGLCPWRDFDVEVSSEVMIPRQETELLVDLALQRVKGQLIGRWRDLGTGSGAIAISLARALPDWFGHAVDCSINALSLAQKNLSNLAPSKKLRTHLGNWWEPLKPWWGSFDLVISNPPYIPEALLEGLHPVIKDHEPHLALVGGEDGLDCCKEIINGAKDGLRSGGWLVFEHNCDHSERALTLLAEKGFQKIDFYNDLEGVKRFALAQKP